MFTLRYSFKGMLQLASFWLIFAHFFAPNVVWSQKELETAVLLCPLAEISAERLAEDYRYLTDAGFQRPTLDVRLGCDAASASLPKTKASSPENIRSALLKARQHYDNLDIQALNGVLNEVANQIQSLQNPFLFKELLGAYLLLRTESALIQDDKNEANQMLGLYARTLGKGAKINAALYTPTLRQLFADVSSSAPVAEGTLRVRFPQEALSNIRIAVNLKSQPITVDSMIELSLSRGLHALSLQAKGMVPVFKFVEIASEQVSEINWYPQAENAAQKRAAWRERFSRLPSIDAQALAQLRTYQPGVSIVLMGQQQHMLVTSRSAHTFVPAPSKGAWAAQIKGFHAKSQRQSDEAARLLTPGVLIGLGAAAVVTLGAVVYMLNQLTPIEPPPPIIGEDTGLVTCCVGD
jgi:hypothetical protein